MYVHKMRFLNPVLFHATHFQYIPIIPVLILNISTVHYYTNFLVLRPSRTPYYSVICWLSIEYLLRVPPGAHSSQVSIWSKFLLSVVFISCLFTNSFSYFWISNSVQFHSLATSSPQILSPTYLICHDFFFWRPESLCRMSIIFDNDILYSDFVSFTILVNPPYNSIVLFNYSPSLVH